MKKAVSILLAVLMIATLFSGMIVSNAMATVESATLNKYDFVVTVKFTEPVDFTFAVAPNIYLANTNPWQTIDGSARKITKIDDKTYTIKFNNGEQSEADYSAPINLILDSGAGIYDVATDEPIARYNSAVAVIDKADGTPQPPAKEDKDPIEIVAAAKWELTSLTLTGAAWARPEKFSPIRTTYWVQPYADTTAVTINAKAEAGVTLSYKTDGVDSTNVIKLNKDKMMTGAEIILTKDGTSRSYFVDISVNDAMSHDVVVDYYGLTPWPSTTDKTGILVDQIMGGGFANTKQQQEFIANNYAGSQKNLRALNLPVQKINPNWHALHYHLAVLNGPASIIIDDNWSQKEWSALLELEKEDPGIFIYAKNKNTDEVEKLVDVVYGAMVMNITNENYYTFMVENLLYQCQSTGYDAIFFDSFNLGCIYSFTKFAYENYDGPALKEFKDPQLGNITWADALQEYLTRITRDMNKNGIWMTPNLGNQETTWDPVDNALTNGGMIEGSPMRPDPRPGDEYDLWDWKQSLSRVMYLAQQDRVIYLQPGADVNDTATRLNKFAAYQLVRDDFTYYNLCGDNQSQASWYPEYDIDLGAPIQYVDAINFSFTPESAQDQLLDGYREGDLYVRHFENGIAICNPYEKAVNYTLPTDRNYKKATITGGGSITVDGKATGKLNYIDAKATESVPAMGGMFLISDTKIEAPARGAKWTYATPGGTVTPEISFIDVKESNWFYEAVMAMAEAGIIKGVSPTEFVPNNSIKRADFITLIIRMLGVDEDTSAGSFDDIDDGAYYASAVKTAKALGITTGSGGGLFLPNDQISRQDAFLIISRVISTMLSPDSALGVDVAVLDKFADSDDIANYAKEGLALLVAMDLLSGSNGNMNPTGTLTRAEAAQALYNIAVEFNLI